MRKILALLLSTALAAMLAFPAAADEVDEKGRVVTEYFSSDMLEDTFGEAVAAAVSLSDLSALKAKAAILVDRKSGSVLFESNADEQLSPASITKVMSLLLITEAIADGRLTLETKVTCSEHASSMGGSQIWFEVGETMTVDELLKAVAVGSANDATVALAEAVAGSEEAFVDMMNARAKELGMTNTCFKNCSGLDADGHLTTARDIAIMSCELMKHSLIKKYTTIWIDSLRSGATQLVNTNKLIRFYPGATGLKTGTTDKAGCCLSASAERDGLSLVAVVLGSPTSNDRFASAKALLNYGFSNYCEASVPISLGKQSIVPVNHGTQMSVKLKVKDKLALLTEKVNKDGFSVQLELPDEVDAPVKKGEVIGRAVVYLNAARVGEAEITAAEKVDKMDMPHALQRMLSGLLTN